MNKKDGIFIITVCVWLLTILIEVIIFPTFAKDYGFIVNLGIIFIIFLYTMPKLFNIKYNNWLESDLVKILTIKEIRNKKLKKINRNESQKWFRK